MESRGRNKHNWKFCPSAANNSHEPSKQERQGRTTRHSMQQPTKPTTTTIKTAIATTTSTIQSDNFHPVFLLRRRKARMWLVHNNQRHNNTNCHIMGNKHQQAKTNEVVTY
eukprot:10690123-Ditylum_brightwellii.AAC.1